MKTLLRKLNWRLIAVHFLASSILILAFRNFILLHDYNYLKAVFDSMANKNIREVEAARISIDVMYLKLSGVVGSLVGFVISLLISRKKDWYWVNSLLVFITVVVVFRYAAEIPIPYFIINHYILFNKLHYQELIIVDSTIVLVIALFLFFSKYVIKFIDQGAHKVLTT